MRMTGAVVYLLSAPLMHSLLAQAKGKGKGQVLDIALLHDEHMLRSASQSPKWQLIGMSLPQRIMWRSIARASEQLDPRCSMQTYHCPNQLH